MPTKQESLDTLYPLRTLYSGWDPAVGRKMSLLPTVARNLSLAGFDDIITRKGFLRRTGLVPSLFGEEG